MVLSGSGRGGGRSGGAWWVVVVVVGTSMAGTQNARAGVGMCVGARVCYTCVCVDGHWVRSPAHPTCHAQAHAHTLATPTGPALPCPAYLQLGPRACHEAVQRGQQPLHGVVVAQLYLALGQAHAWAQPAAGGAVDKSGGGGVCFMAALAYGGYKTKTRGHLVIACTNTVGEEGRGKARYCPGARRPSSPTALTYAPPAYLLHSPPSPPPHPPALATHPAALGSCSPPAP